VGFDGAKNGLRIHKRATEDAVWEQRPRHYDCHSQPIESGIYGVQRFTGNQSVNSYDSNNRSLSQNFFILL